MKQVAEIEDLMAFLVQARGGALPGDELVQFSPDGRFIFVRGPGDAAIEFSRLDLSSGRRELSRLAQRQAVGERRATARLAA